jgi:hypothetical protein
LQDKVRILTLHFAIACGKRGKYALMVNMAGFALTQ